MNLKLQQSGFILYIIYIIYSDFEAPAPKDFYVSTLNTY